MMKIIVLGGDGFCGWPTSIHLSSLGYEIIIVDDLSRRKIDVELAVDSLTPILPLPVRLRAWKEITGRDIHFFQFNIATDYYELHSLIEKELPDAIIHFAEQRSAPYSMKSAAHKRYTVNNNLNSANNLLAAVAAARSRAHIVHLGSIGVYGYGSSVAAKIPEGYLNVKIVLDDGSEATREILYPTTAESIYHMTKAQNQLLFAFYNKNDGVRVTDLHQGIVWGTQTPETCLDEKLINRFDYDGDYGTVLNRFLLQGALGYPLTIYGTGGQTRAFIHICDTVRCIRLALENPPAHGERVRIVNQISEVYSVRDLAERVAKLTGAKIAYVENPRIEAATNDFSVCNDTLLRLGLQPILLKDGLMKEVTAIAHRYAHRCNLSSIPCVSKWRQQ